MTSLALASSVKCDWLDVTFSPTDAPLGELRAFFDSIGGEVLSSAGDDRQSWRLGGVLVLDERARFVRVSASGLVLEYMRERSAFFSFLAILGEQPHAVTRLDACVDSESPGHLVVGDLWRRHPRTVNLTRKAVPTKRIVSTTNDGHESGTFYAGHRTAAKVTARVYDKRLERIERGGYDPGHDWTRYELTVRKDVGATLRDAAQPERIFWHFMAPALLKAPQGVDPWDSGWGTGWEYRPPDIAPYERLRRRVDASGEIARLLELADAVGPNGRDWLVSLISRRAGVKRSA